MHDHAIHRHKSALGPAWKVRASVAGLHLFDRSRGVNILVDEVLIPAALQSPAPRQVSVALTNACDLACNFCYAPKTRATLDMHSLSSWLVELDDAGCLGVGFGGGEPTLYAHFAELCRFTARETQLAVSFTTHAHHLQGRLLEELRGNVHYVRVSMDGVGHVYETIRRRSFKELLARLSEVRTLCAFGINFVVNSQTFVDIDAAASLAADVGASEFLLLPERPARGAAGIDSATSTGLRRWVERYRGAVPLVVSESAAAGMPYCNPVAGEEGTRAYAHIDAAGILKLTSYDTEGVAIGIGGIMPALKKLRERQEAMNEDLA